jgi:tetratricopeptide (TPR) repeat protein
VVVDDAPDSASVRSFVPPAPCALLVTSRARITLEPPMQVVDLDLLTDTESETLLLQLAPRLGADTRTADLLAHCANLPLALRVVGNTLRERPDLSTDRYLARLADETRRLGALRHDDRDVYAILGVSDTLLAEHDPMLAERWRMLHVCPAPFDRAVVAALWAEEDEDALDDGLGELLRRSLLSYDGASGRYRLHDVLRDVARQRCDAAALAIANERHSQYFSWLLDRAGRLYRQGGQDVLQGLVLFDANLSHILVGQAWAVIKEGADQLILDYALIFPEALVLRLHPHIRIRWLEAAKAAAQRCGDIRSEGIVLGNLGMAYADLGEVTMAISLYQQQLVIAQNLGNRHSESIALTNLGIAYKDLGEVRRAIGIHEQRIWIARSLGDKLGEGRALSNLGIAYHELGELRSAISCYEHHLEIARAIEDFSGEAIALGNLGVAYRDFGDVERALSYFKPVLALSRRMGNRQSESKVLCNLGNIYSDLGKMDQAITFYEQCLELTQVIGDRQIEGIVLGNLGIVYNTLGEVDRAIAYYEQHLQLVQLIEDRPGEVLTCWNLGRALASQGNYVRAAELMQRYVEYLHELGHPDSEAFEDHLEDVRRKIE